MEKTLHICYMQHYLLYIMVAWAPNATIVRSSVLVVLYILSLSLISKNLSHLHHRVRVGGTEEASILNHNVFRKPFLSHPNPMTVVPPWSAEEKASPSSSLMRHLISCLKRTGFFKENFSLL